MERSKKRSFEARFDIEVPLDEAKSLFVNRVHNHIDHLYWQLEEDERPHLLFEVLHALGKRMPRSQVTHLAEEIGNDFARTLKAIEAMYWSAAGASGFDLWKDWVESFVRSALAAAETDLGIGWRDGEFIGRGAAVLDEALVDGPLHWLRREGFKAVLDPFEKGLKILLEVHLKDEPQRLFDVVTDMYEALEAMAKIVTGRSELDLSANRELFVQKVAASEEYKRLLKEYVDYAHRFRHAPSDKRPRPQLSYPEAESFVYLTGLFLRLAMSVS
jgi:hypothetical protein